MTTRDYPLAIRRAAIQAMDDLVIKALPFLEMSVFRSYSKTPEGLRIPWRNGHVHATIQRLKDAMLLAWRIIPRVVTVQYVWCFGPNYEKDNPNIPKLFLAESFEIQFLARGSVFFNGRFWNRYFCFLKNVWDLVRECPGKPQNQCFGSGRLRQWKGFDWFGKEDVFSIEGFGFFTSTLKKP